MRRCSLARSPGLGRAVRVALLLAILLAGAGASADAAISRRLAALRNLERAPHAHRALAALPAREADFVCPVRRAPDPPALLELRIHRAVRDASRRYGVDASLVRSVIRHESAGRPDAVSVKGAMGLMQLMPGTARELGVVCPFDPRENVLAGTRYLRQLHDRLGSWGKAVAGYHAGPARALAGRLGPETRRYVGRVLHDWRFGD